MKILHDDTLTLSPWWVKFQDELLPSYLHYIALESQAKECWLYYCDVVPDKLQTESKKQVDLEVQVRLKRQWLVHEQQPPQKLNVILDESVLYRTIGGHAAVLREQLQHLLYMSELPHITIRLAPFVFDGDMLHHIGSFQILFADKHQPLALYFDNGKNNGEPINDVALIEIWHQRLASFRRQTLNPHESRNAIRKALDSMYPPLS